MSGDTLTIEILAAGVDDMSLVARAYTEVLAPSFTKNELPPFDVLEPGLEAATVVVGIQGGELVSAAVVERDDGDFFGLLSHLAVRPGRRSAGVGAMMMRRLRELWNERGIPVVLGEVHDPRLWETTDTERPVERLTFYDRQGARLLTTPWVQPRLWAGGERVPGMLLLVMHDVEDGFVAAGRLADWMTEYYVACEGPEASTDPTLTALLDRVHAVDPVPMVALSELELMPPLNR